MPQRQRTAKKMKTKPAASKKKAKTSSKPMTFRDRIDAAATASAQKGMMMNDDSPKTLTRSQKRSQRRRAARAARSAKKKMETKKVETVLKTMDETRRTTSSKKKRKRPLKKGVFVQDVERGANGDEVQGKAGSARMGQTVPVEYDEYGHPMPVPMHFTPQMATIDAYGNPIPFAPPVQHDEHGNPVYPYYLIPYHPQYPLPGHPPAADAMMAQARPTDPAKRSRKKKNAPKTPTKNAMMMMNGPTTPRGSAMTKPAAMSAAMNGGSKSMTRSQRKRAAKRAAAAMGKKPMADAPPRTMKKEAAKLTKSQRRNQRRRERRAAARSAKQEQTTKTKTMRKGPAPKAQMVKMQKMAKTTDDMEMPQRTKTSRRQKRAQSKSMKMNKQKVTKGGPKVTAGTMDGNDGDWYTTPPKPGKMAGFAQKGNGRKGGTMGKSAPMAVPRTKYAPICQMFGSVVGCKWGRECFNSHSDPNSVRFCMEFARTGKCYYDDTCYDRHVVWKKVGDQWVEDRKATAAFVAKARGQTAKKVMGTMPKKAAPMPTDKSMMKVTHSTLVAKTAAPMPDDDGGMEDDGYTPKKKVTFREPLKEVNGPNKPMKGSGGKHEAVMFHENPPSYSYRKGKGGRYTAFNKIDYGLATYYEICGRTDYFNTDGIGKFMECVQSMNFKEVDIAKALGEKATAAKCPFIAMDDDFPLKKDYRTKAAREKAIFQVIQRCYKYGQIYGMLAYHKEVNWQGFFKEVRGRDAVANRMINALKYYSSIDPLGRDDHYQQFMEFVNDTYTGRIANKYGEWRGLLQDFAWMFMDYGEHRNANRVETLKSIQSRMRPHFESMCPCNETNCLLCWLGSNKGHRFKNSAYIKDRSKDKNRVLFYRDLLDAMHCYLVHGYDVGLRIKVMTMPTEPQDIPCIFYARGKCTNPDCEYLHERHPVDNSWRRYRDPTFRFVTSIQCSSKYKVFVFSREDCITRS